jgi:outer membrane protein
MRPEKILIPLLLLGSLHGSGQTLREFVAQALENNYDIRITRNEEKIAALSNTAGNAGMLPSVGLDGAFNRNINNTRQQFFITEDRVGTNARTDNTSARLTADWLIFGGFRVQGRRDQLRYLEELGAAESRFLIEQTVTDLASLYYQLASARERLKVYASALDVSASRLKLEEMRRETGTSGILPFYQALMDYQSDSALFRMEESTVRNIEIQLNTLARNTPEPGVNFPAEITYPEIQAAPEEIARQAIQASQELRMARVTELIADAQSTVNRAVMYPEISIFGGYAYSQLSNEVGFLKSSRNYGPEYGVSIRFNLFNGGQTQTTIRNDELRELNAALTTQQIQLSLESAVARNAENLASLGDRIRLARQTTETARETVEVARRQYAQGLLSGMDFRTIQLEATRTELTLTGLLQARAEVALQLHRLAGTVVETALQ